MRKQLAFMLGRQYVGLELNDEPKDKSDLMNIMSNSHINEHFNSLAREVSILIFLVLIIFQMCLIYYIVILVGYFRT